MIALQKRTLDGAGIDEAPEVGAIFSTTSVLGLGSIWAPSFGPAAMTEKPVSELRLPSAFALRERTAQWYGAAAPHVCPVLRSDSMTGSAGKQDGCI